MLGLLGIIILETSACQGCEISRVKYELQMLNLNMDNSYLCIEYILNEYSHFVYERMDMRKEAQK